MPRLIALGLCLALAACSEAAEPDTHFDVQRLPVTVTLAEGKSVEVSGTVIGFDGVTSDSRCPSDVVCVWAGNAVVRVTIGPSVGEGPVHLATLNTTLEPHSSGEVYGLVVTLVDLLPYPVSTGAAKHYRAVVRIDRVP